MVALMRRFVVEFFNGHDTRVCTELMDPEYRLHVAGDVIIGRDAHYVPAVQRQFDQFPGLGMTVHRLVASDDRAAIHFSEHGASGGVGGRVATWAGIALYRRDRDRLTTSFAEEDYAARRRQLTSGTADPVEPPAAAPWDISTSAPDPEAERVVLSWLEQGLAGGGVAFDDEHLGLAAPLVFDVENVAVTELFSAGHDVAFHAALTGRELAQDVQGLPARAVPAQVATITAAGIVSTAGGAVVGGTVIRNRAALQRARRAE
jgi:predicted ester cyclase